MATASKAVRTILTSDVGLAAIIDEVYVLAFPSEPTLPVQVYRVISGAHVATTAPSQPSEKTTRFQIDTWAEDYDTTQDVKELMTTLWDGYQGTVNGVKIFTTSIDLEFDQFEEETKLYRYVCDISVTHGGA